MKYKKKIWIRPVGKPVGFMHPEGLVQLEEVTRNGKKCYLLTTFHQATGRKANLLFSANGVGSLYHCLTTKFGLGPAIEYLRRQERDKR